MHLLSFLVGASCLLGSRVLADRVGGPSDGLLERMTDNPSYTYNVTECAGESLSRITFAPGTLIRLDEHLGYSVQSTTEHPTGILANLSLIQNCSAFGIDSELSGNASSDLGLELIQKLVIQSLGSC